MEIVASLSQGRTAAAQCGLFTQKSVPVIFEPPCMLFSYMTLPTRNTFDKTCDHTVSMTHSTSKAKGHFVLLQILHHRTETIQRTVVGNKRRPPTLRSSRSFITSQAHTHNIARKPTHEEFRFSCARGHVYCIFVL